MPGRRRCCSRPDRRRRPCRCGSRRIAQSTTPRDTTCRLPYSRPPRRDRRPMSASPETTGLAVWSAVPQNLCTESVFPLVRKWDLPCLTRAHFGAQRVAMLDVLLCVAIPTATCGPESATSRSESATAIFEPIAPGSPGTMAARRLRAPLRHLRRSGATRQARWVLMTISVPSARSPRDACLRRRSTLVLLPAASAEYRKPATPVEQPQPGLQTGDHRTRRRGFMRADARSSRFEVLGCRRALDIVRTSHQDLVDAASEALLRSFGATAAAAAERVARPAL